MLGPGTAGTATEQLWGQAEQHHRAWPPCALRLAILCAAGMSSPWGGSTPISTKGFCLGGLPKTARPRGIPHLSSAPTTFGCPPRSPPLPAQPYPFQVELSWGEGSRGAGTGRAETGARGGEQGERIKR